MTSLRGRHAMPLDAAESHRNTRQRVRQLQCTSLKNARLTNEKGGPPLTVMRKNSKSVLIKES